MLKSGAVTQRDWQRHSAAVGAQGNLWQPPRNDWQHKKKGKFTGEILVLGNVFESHTLI